MKFEGSNLLECGIYTVPEASRLTRVSSRRIRYWLQGRASEQRMEGTRPRLWKGQFSPIDHKFALGFLDLHEIRFVDAFLKAGVSWRLLRRAHQKGIAFYHTQHPFCTHRFVTDGHSIFDSILKGKTRELVDVAHQQRVFAPIFSTFLKDLVFSNSEQIESWWPLGQNKKVVLDPKRQFGQPITATGGVPTDVLYGAVKAEQSLSEVAAWFEIDTGSVRDACDFEVSLLA